MTSEPNSDAQGPQRPERRRRTRPRWSIRKVEDRVQELHEREVVGESAETPAIAIAGLLLFLIPIVLLIMGIAFAVYYLT
jgi:hypothetical protein